MIDNLLERVESLEKKLSTSKSQLEKESDVEEEIPIEDETSVDDEQFKCSKCDFESFSNKGLKIHMKKKHTNYETLNYPRTCDFCEKIFENGFELRKHMKLHSFKGTLFGEYKCEECDFYGDSLEMMEVHAGKCRNDDFDCGLCHHKFARLEELKTHLASCEVYECAECYNRENSLSDIKLHIENTHDKTKKFFHLKMNRKRNEKVDIKEYAHKDI